MALPTNITPNDTRHVELHTEANTEINRLTAVVGTPASTATANALVKRDSAGHAQFATPSAAADAATKSYVDTAIAAIPPTGADLLSKLKAPMVISHRGGSLVHPEHSMEGYIDSMNSGFYPEQDIQFLSDGTPVCIHDSTLDRTTSGSGNVSSINIDAWRKLRILNPMSGGRTAQTVTFEEVLDRLGGQVVLVSEIKNGATAAQATTCMNMVKERGLQKAVLFQSFDYAVVKQVIAAGFQCVYLVGSSLPSQSNATMLADGVKYVSPSTGMTSANMNALTAAGFRLLPYTIRTPPQAQALPSTVFGYFTDDPWWCADRLQAESVGRWERGEAWPGMPPSGIYEGQVATNTVDLRKEIEISAGGVRYRGYTASVDGKTAPLVTIPLDHLTGGPINRPLFVQARFILGRHAASDTRTVGFTVWKNTDEPDAFFADGALAGQSGFTFAYRRNGMMEGWQYLDGAKAVTLGTGIQATPVPNNGAYNWREVVLRLELGANWIGFHNLTDSLSYTASVPMSGPFRVGLRIGGTEAMISDITVGPWTE